MQTSLINPDINFIKKMKKAGGDSFKKCFQCATCSVICDNSPEALPFPRKQMILTGWGMKDKLFSDPTIWLCHQCDDCSQYCPRDAKPMEVMAALRKLAIEHYAVPSFMARWISDIKFLPIILAIPIIILTATLFITGKWGIPAGQVFYDKMYSHLTINILFTSLVFFSCLMAFIGIKSFWNNMEKSVGSNFKERVPIIKAFFKVVGSIFLHNKFKKCNVNENRFFSHLAVFLGFVGLFIVTGLAVFSILLYDYYPLPQTNFIKILGNISALSFLVGLIMIVVSRTTTSEYSGHKGIYFDWIFLIDLFVIIITGVVLEFLRIFNLPYWAYPGYFIHLVAVSFLLVYFPYSKFAHVVYRFVAMLYAAHLNKNY